MEFIVNSMRAVGLASLLALSFQATAQQYSCGIAIAGSIDFLVYNPASGSPALASTTASLTCTHISGGTQRINWTMELSNGSSGNCNARALPGPSGTLSYNIYQNSVAGGVWGNIGCATYPFGQITVGPGAGNGTRTVQYTMYGQVPSGQFVAAGTYIENLTLTISY